MTFNDWLDCFLAFCVIAKVAVWVFGGEGKD